MKFFGDDRVAFKKDVAAFRVTDDDKIAAEIGKHQRRNLSGKSTSLFPVAVLRGQFDPRFFGWLV